jgi:hypothetical protein
MYPESLDYLKDRGISQAVAENLGWGFSTMFNGQDRYCIAMPHILNGKLVGAKFKTLDVKEFSQYPGSSITGLYGRDLLDPNANDVFVFEGPDDVALAMSYGYNATGLIAAGSPLTGVDISTLDLYKRIYLVGDQDKAEGEKYANSHQIGAGVVRAYAVVSEDRPKLQRVRVVPTLCRGAEPYGMNLIAFPVIKDHHHFGLAENSMTDADKVVEWIRTNHPDGCTETTVCDKMKGLRNDRKHQALNDAIAQGRLKKVLSRPETGRPGYRFVPAEFPPRRGEESPQSSFLPDSGNTGEGSPDNLRNEHIPF